jgi:hypothetical protein
MNIHKKQNIFLVKKNFTSLQMVFKKLVINKLHPKVSVKFHFLKLYNFTIENIVIFVEGFAVSCPVKGSLASFPPTFFKRKYKTHL